MRQWLCTPWPRRAERIHAMYIRGRQAADGVLPSVCEGAELAAVSRRLRILHVVNTLETGGAERFVVDLARAQHAGGHSVRVHCLFGGGPLLDDLARARIRVEIPKATTRLRRLRTIARDLREHRPHVVHCHNVAATLLAAPLASLYRVPCVLSTRHGVDDNATGGWEEAKFWIAARTCSRVVCVSEATARVLVRSSFASAARLATILNGAHAPTLPVVSRVDDSIVLLSVARLKWPKDHHTLLHAIAKLRPSQSRVELWLVGDGPDRDRLEQLSRSLGLAGVVRFLGDQREVGPWLARADLFVLSSAAEGASVALIEALSAGVVPIVSDVGGNREIIERSGVGFLFPPRDAVALTETLAAVLAQRHRWSEWQRRARHAYTAHFTLGRVVGDYDRLMADVLRSRRRV